MTEPRRRIVYVSGTRADFGLMASTLRALADDERVRLSLLVTGMHLSARHGHTVDEIEQSGLTIDARIEVDLQDLGGAAMARNIGRMLIGFVDALQRDRPDLLLVLGDRGEMLAGALAAIHLNIPVAHLHGGERSGTVDEPIRHAISKLSHLHLVATDGARERLVRMGERADRIHIVGAPGLDGLTTMPAMDREALCRDVGLAADRPLALLLFHPVLAEADRAAHQAQAIVDALASEKLAVIALMPNSDAGNEGVCGVLARAARARSFVVATHLPRSVFVSWMACCDLMVGNSSSGIIEAASFGTRVVNVGSRQNLRERNANVVDVDAAPDALRAALRRAVADHKHRRRDFAADLRERFSGGDPVPLPPPALRHRVGPNSSRAEFLHVGALCADDLTKVYAGLGRPAQTDLRWLDFGSGCGRVARHLLRPGALERFGLPALAYTGVDVDRRQIAWAARHLPGRFEVIPAAPPTGLAGEAFDVVFTISVFTHLDEAAQNGWLAELSRLLRPGGLLLA
ncbi:MAG: UDP-N-acetylglucosamine 2-epimerase, partial [Caldimonas sp.]